MPLSLLRSRALAGGNLLAITLGMLAVTSVIAMAVGCAIFTQVSAHDSYWRHIFFGLLGFGPGLGAAYVSASVAALSGVAEADAVLAFGLNNASFQIGGAIGVAIVTSVAVSVTGVLGSRRR